MPMPTLTDVHRETTDIAPTKDRKPTIVPSPVTSSPELTARPRRRSFTAEDKLRILAETDRAAQTGEIGAILRREGLYSSLLTDWRRQRDAGPYGALSAAKRGPKPTALNPLAAERAGLQAENARLQRRLDRAEAIIAVPNAVRAMIAHVAEPASAAEGHVPTRRSPAPGSVVVAPALRCKGEVSSSRKYSQLLRRAALGLLGQQSNRLIGEAGGRDAITMLSGVIPAAMAIQQ